MAEGHHRHHHKHKHRSRSESKGRRKLSRGAVWSIVAGAVILVAALVVLLLQTGSYSLALTTLGMETDNIHMVARDHRDMEGNQFRVVQGQFRSGDMGFAVVTQNRWGFWKVTQYRLGSMGDDPHFVEISWTQSGGIRTYDLAGDMVYGQERHLVFCGDNALSLVELEPAQIPANVTVNIQQAGERYWIHTISFADEQTLENFDVKALLAENGCIPAE